MKEWHRTVALVILLAFAIGFIIWLNTGFEHTALDTLQ